VQFEARIMIDWIRHFKYYLVAAAVLLVLVGARTIRNWSHEVAVAEAHIGSLNLQIAASGLVESESTDLAFVGGGRIVKLYVKEGDTVTESDLLARLAPVEAAPNLVDIADVIKAPYDGHVVTIYQRAGSVVGPGQPVLRLVSSLSSWVVAFVESEDAVHLQRGQKLSCRAGGYLSQAWNLTVEEIGKEAVTRADLPGSAAQVRVRCSVDDPGFPLPPGTEVDVDGNILLAGHGVLVPTAAVVHEGSQDWVWTVEDNKVRRRPVEVGPNNFDLIQIRSGVRPTDLVVVNGKEGLEEGQRVTAQPVPPMDQATARGD